MPHNFSTMHLLRGFVIVSICVGFTPGLAELFSDGLHAVAEGHTHHAEGHEEPGPEHGCNGWQHSCACHISLSVAPAVTAATVPTATLNDIEAASPTSDEGPSGVRDELERPPRA